MARDLVQEPRTLREGTGWREEVIGALTEMFYEVRRFVLDAGAEAADDTQGRFHILNVVEGEGITVRTAAGDRHELAYAETLTVLRPRSARTPFERRPVVARCVS